MKKLLAIVIALFGLGWQGFSQDAPSETPQVDEGELPRIPATEPEDALETFELVDGYRLELVAAEPLVMDPIAVAFDEAGAMFVIEMRGYSERRDDQLGCVKKLIDTDGDGVYDQATIYADGLRWPTAIVCYKGGIFVGATPDLFYFKDTNGDGVAEEKRVALTGFGPPPEQMKVNMQALFNDLQWGPDNRIWGASSSNGGNVNGVNLRGSDFSFDPEMLDLRPENGVGQNGMTFDADGNRYVCSNSNHIVRVMWERQWVDANPFYSLPRALVSIADDGKAAPVFRISADEPWRIVRTRWRVSGVVKGMVEGGGRVSGYFTSATGITMYDGDAMPQSRGMAFIGDVGSNLVHRKKILHHNGATQPIATRIDDEVEIIASRDNWFRPVNFANAPDGSLYVIDMYRETIEHPWSIPEGIKKHLDLNSGNDRGRIYRLSATGWNRATPENLALKTDLELKELLSEDSGNSWTKTTARRLLYERGNPAPELKPDTPFTKALAASKTDNVDLQQLALEAGSDPWRIAAVVNATRSMQQATQVYENGSEALRVEIGTLLSKANWEGAAEMLSENNAPISVWAAFSAGGKTSGQIAEHAAEVLAKAERVVSDPNSAIDERADAFQLLANVSRLEVSLLEKILTNNKNPIRFRIAAFDAFAKIEPTRLAEVIVGIWTDLPTEVKNHAIPFLVFPKKDRALILLEAVKSGTIAAAEIPPDQANKLRAHSSKQVTALAKELIPAPALVKRSEVVKKYEAALKLAGDPAAGELVYQKACMICHQSPDGQGFSVGPEITTFKTAGADSILKNVFDPNAEIAPQYQTFEIKLANGEAIIGMIANENQTEVTVRAAAGQERTFPRKEVASMKGLGVSLMPEGLEATVTIQEMADLLAYLTKD